MAGRYKKFVLPVEGGSVVVGRIKEVLVGEEDNIQRPSIGNPATSCIATVCTMLLWIAVAGVCLAIGIIYRDKCDNLESNIPLYLIAQGILSLVYAVTCGLGCCLLANYSQKISSWIVFTIAIINTLMTMISMVWTIIGSIWVWNNWEDWDDNHKLCTNEVYITAMAFLLISYGFWIFTFCFAACQIIWSICDKDSSDF